MRLKYVVSGLFLALSLALALNVTAQSPSVEWLAWDAQITTQANSTQLSIVETQTVQVTSGTLHSGQRDYSQPVSIQSVYVAVNSGQRQQLSQGGGAGNYQITPTNGDMILDYQLPQAVSAGDQFALEINYTVASPTSGLIDWFIVPGAHDGSVRSSIVTINFPAGQVPDTSFVRMPQGTGTVTTAGNSITIQSQGAIPANQSFEIQVPFSASAANANSPNNSNPVQTAPATPTSSGGGLSTILLVLCVVGIVVIVVGFLLVKGLLGGIGNLFGGNRSSNPVSGNPGSPLGGGSSFGNSPPAQGRGFRDSGNQNRELPPISNDKKSGGGASFK